MKKAFTLIELLSAIAFIVIFAAIIYFVLFGGNAGARRLGGSVVHHLPVNRKVVSCSWKENDLWVLTREMKPDESPEILNYKEYSQYGLMQGEVKIVETKN